MNKTFEVEEEEYKFQIPKVTISGINTDSVNKKILKDNPVSLYDPKEEFWGLTFSYHIDGTVISLLVDRYNINEMFHEYFVYNISVETGKLLDNKSFLNICGTTEEEFLSIVRDIYSKLELEKEWFEQEDKEATLKMATFEYIHPYLNEKGQLCFVGMVQYEEDEDEPIGLETLFNTVTDRR